MNLKMRVVSVAAILLLFLFLIWSGGASDALVERSAVLEISPGTAQVSRLPQGEELFEFKRDLLNGDGYKIRDDRFFLILVSVKGRGEARKGLSPHLDSWVANLQLTEAKIWLNGRAGFENVPQPISRVSQIVFVEESHGFWERFKQKVLSLWPA